MHCFRATILKRDIGRRGSELSKKRKRQSTLNTRTFGSSFAAYEGRKASKSGRSRFLLPSDRMYKPPPT